MRTRLPARSAGALAAIWFLACGGVLSVAHGDGQKTRQDDGAAAAAALVAEVRRAFTIHDKPIPPEIFRDFGDGDLADSGNIWVTVDVAATIGSNLYFDAIKTAHGWISQTKPGRGTDDAEVTGYDFIGATKNGLLVVLASYSGGGSGDFMTLHVLDVAASRAFGDEGKPYWRINLTSLRSVALGDRWDGEVSIAGNTIRIVTTRSGPADDSGARRTKSITAERP